MSKDPYDAIEAAESAMTYGTVRNCPHCENYEARIAELEALLREVRPLIDHSASSLPHRIDAALGEQP
jgi:hypothetical protein